MTTEAAQPRRSRRARGEPEDKTTWQRFLERLEGCGLVAERGLELIVHDGGRGVAVALMAVYFAPDMALRWCVFYKHCNAW